MSSLRTTLPTARFAHGENKTMMVYAANCIATRTRLLVIIPPILHCYQKNKLVISGYSILFRPVLHRYKFFLSLILGYRLFA